MKKDMYGTVQPNAGLNLRKTENGQVLSVLPKGTKVQILEEKGPWYQVVYSQTTGYLFGKYVSLDVNLDHLGEDDFTIDGDIVFGPNGQRFARVVGNNKGLVDYGTTTIGDFVTIHRTKFSDLSPSLLNVMEAVSANEGKLEAINTYDNAFMTFGAFQWTAGVGTGQGELPAMLALLKTQKPKAFAQHFSKHGLDVAKVSARRGQIPRGELVLNGTILDGPRKKERLRTTVWAYRFWNAGHDEHVQEAEIRHAASRIHVFYNEPTPHLNGKSISDYVSSEYGVALLLDQHVNRPAHVLPVMKEATQKMSTGSKPHDPSVWGFGEEQTLLKIYLKLRRKTDMTDSQHRAGRTWDAVVRGEASDQRGSFIL